MISRKHIFIVFTLLLSACSGLPAFENSNEATIPLGPQITITQHQVNVFESSFSLIEEHYIHYEIIEKDWEALKEKYLTEINAGLSNSEFNELMTQFESEFGDDEVIYISREERIRAESSIQTTQFVGIGAFINFQAEDVPHVVILDVMPDSPAEKAGLQAHDSIYAVDGEAVNAEEGANVVQRIRGEAGTTVVLSVQSPGEERQNVEIVRAPVNGIGELKINQLQNNEIGYILIPPSVSEDAINQLALALSNFAKAKIKGLILDLRIANGENNWPLQDMLIIFLNGAVGDIYNRTESDLIKIEGQDVFGSQSVPLVVLVGEQTYGAPEIFAAFVQSAQRGIVIGAPTSGNIERTVGYPLQNGGQIFIASASIRTNQIDNLGLSGFTPDIQVNAKWDEIISSQDPVIEQALQFFKLKAEE
jgi:carboxyl-terminal processing protease